MSLTTRVLLGLVLGLAVGVLLAPADSGWARDVVEWVTPLGDLWVNAIRMTVIPLIASLLVGSIAGAGSGVAARVGGKAMAWFVGLIAGTAALTGVAAPPLLRLTRADQAQIPAAAGLEGSAVTLPPFGDWFVGLLPANPVQAAAEGAILPLVLFTAIFGFAATRIDQDLRALVVRGARAVSETMLVIVEWILAVAPVGVFALTLGLGARTGTALVVSVAGFLFTAVLLIIVAGLALYPLVTGLTGVPLRRFARACAPAQAVGFSTRSSVASLPVMLEEAEETLHLPEEVSGLVLPAAVSVFKYASPVTRITGTAFVASLFGVHLGMVEWVVVVLGLAALTFYSPGIPSGGLFVMAPLYQSLGLPLEGIGILIALDLVPDMFLTAANVTGDLAVAVLVAGSDQPGGPPG